MPGFSDDLEKHLRAAVKYFWAVRQRQARSQGGEVSDAKDRGQRGAVTGGKQMDGLCA
ncbi:MAG TPA: hypothetical protein VG125_18380 [Pirellulales bacterium]|jgi:hypothetical protein|nr:hypothetical protein [Pirellulales bacterium]